MRRAYAGLCWALSLGQMGCDPTAGLADSAGAAIPDVKRYFDGRGSKLSEGPWYRVIVDLDTDTLYHVGARRLDDEQPTFHLFGADAREGCGVAPNVGTWLMGKPRDAPFRVLPFVESLDERGRGRMRFTGLDCSVRDLVIEDAGRPYPRLYDHGYVVPTKRGYTFADPWLGTQQPIADELQGVLVWDDAILIQADERLKSFTEQFEPGSEWGNAPIAVVPLKGNFLVEDADGIHRVTFDHDTLAIESEPILAGACHLQRASLALGGWVAVQTPCDNPKPTLLQLDLDSYEVRASFELPFEADARYVRSLMKPTSDEPAPFAALYLTDVDDEQRGTLWAWQEGMEAAIELGDHADLDSGYLLDPEGAWQGAAHVNQRKLGDYSVYDWIRFRWDGTTSAVASGVLTSAPSGETLVNFDGVAGDLAWFLGDGYEIRARGVSPSLGELSSFVGTPHYARLDQFDGESGRVRMGTTEGDPAAWSATARAVPPDSVRFAWFMPALVFIENWDAQSRTGSLVAYNYELDARATIAEGVSSFDLTSYPLEGVVYAVPSGAQQGLWFSKAK